MKCEIANCTVTSPLYRNAPLGIVPAHWRCLEHLDNEYKPEQDLKELVEVICNDE